jgi:hypothetical protein
MSHQHDQHHQLSQEERVAAIKRAEAEGRKGIGQPGVESASGRDRAGTELPRNAGTNQNDVDLSRVAPPPGAVQGSRTGPQGDPTGALDDRDRDEGRSA